MTLYKIGEIVYKNNNNIILESKGEGNLVTICDNSRYSKGEKLKLYLYEVKNDYIQQTYGFKTFKERLLFTDLISIDKIGPKTAMLILDQNWELVANLIAEGDWKEISKINYISDKSAKLICVELKDKWAKIIQNKEVKKFDDITNIKELKQTLNKLGFKASDIDYAVNNISSTKELGLMVEESINLITTQMHANNQTT
ncbi:Holliday junction branch migration protein RuvA [Mycoplasmopsis synoviae]|uniref:Holliday junction branch migration protein RuvA n=1 Tax=Mycoplasmopsis synoviae TaxID=2109 RepID=UPI000CA0F998|nr:Holliday junction branch migration protein RuvA [Mycoplasmopsis synoviae]AKJ21098.1 Holliday junction DNA helicase RuvA [Mycoplasmopsis synoviae]AQU48435.1 Holliday junction DNA helicase RuvA [Mycoplasmopsis synoviae]AWL84002.1 Holliday junction branch migration protein RuvA [Mycoplasmopsis synoviae]QLE13731.1 Holliday junction branch migration protein RuvA [Mycoplasmopsis synoviae]UZF64490.1 Holliday junction branch migration protein RuvA [Mycoplasmopsis synoviae]